MTSLKDNHQKDGFFHLNINNLKIKTDGNALAVLGLGKEIGCHGSRTGRRLVPGSTIGSLQAIVHSGLPPDGAEPCLCREQGLYQHQPHLQDL
jgi:hypothetical protein